MDVSDDKLIIYKIQVKRYFDCPLIRPVHVVDSEHYSRKIVHTLVEVKIRFTRCLKNIDHFVQDSDQRFQSPITR